MRKLIMWNVITLDGYFEGSEPWDLDFHGLAFGDDLQDFISKQLKTADMLVFGKNTYIGMADYWATEKGEVAQDMNKIKKIVCSSTLNAADWNNTVVVEDAVKEIPKLKQEGEGNMLVFGSAILSESLMKADLFDEYRLCIAPAFLGKGKRLFSEGLPYQKVKLLENRPLQTGGVLLMYGAK